VRRTSSGAPSRASRGTPALRGWVRTPRNRVPLTPGRPDCREAALSSHLRLEPQTHETDRGSLVEGGVAVVNTRWRAPAPHPRLIPTSASGRSVRSSLWGASNPGCGLVPVVSQSPPRVLFQGCRFEVLASLRSTHTRSGISQPTPALLVPRRPPSRPPIGEPCREALARVELHTRASFRFTRLRYSNPRQTADR
jgi:hypothetical protein